MAVYPASGQVQGWAMQNGVDPIQVFAFAASDARLPNNPVELSQFIGSLRDDASTWGVSLDLVLGYVQERGRAPGSRDQLISWAQGRNYIDASGNPIYTPPAGLNYLGGQPNVAGNSANPGAPVANLPANPLGGIEGSLSGLLNEKTLLIAGGALVGLLVLSRGRMRL